MMRKLVNTRSALLWGTTVALVSLGVLVVLVGYLLGFAVSAFGFVVPALGHVKVGSGTRHLEIEVEKTGTVKMFQSCPRCGHVVLSDDDESCQLCGAKIEPEPVPEEAEAKA